MSCTLRAAAAAAACAAPLWSTWANPAAGRVALVRRRGGTGPQTGWHWPVAGRRRAVVNARAEPAQSLGAIETHVSAVGDPTVQYGMSVPRRCVRCVGPRRVVARGRPPLKGRGEARRRVQARAAADAQARRGRRLEGEPRVATCKSQRKTCSVQRVAQRKLCNVQHAT